VVLQREEFCRLSLKPDACVRELCRRYGISASTGYEWRRRYLEIGLAGLEDRSRRPLSSPRRTPDEIEVVVMEAMKLILSLPAPSAGTIAAIRCAPGETVAGGARLIDTTPEEPA
jgi:hypothetical protein